MTRIRDEAVPLFDLGAQHAALQAELMAALAAVLIDGRYVGGPAVAAFEAAWAGYCGTAHAVGVGNGTDALEVALAGLGLGRGDEVIVPAHTYAATAEAVRNAGALPVFADIDPRSYTLDPAAAEACVTPRTAAILAVHLYGQPADMAALRALADRRGLALIEDAAQAHGAAWAGRRAGSLGDVACFSFYPSKNLGALGDAGAVVTADAALADRVRAIRDHGQRARDRHEAGGRNSRLDALQAAALMVKLPHLEAWNAARRAIAARYDAELPARHVRLPWTAPEATHVYHVYSVRVVDERVGAPSARDGLAARLARAGIGTRIYYPVPVHRQPAFADAPVPHGAPEAERAAREMLALPMYPELGPEAVERVVAAVRAAAARERRGG